MPTNNHLKQIKFVIPENISCIKSTNNYFLFLRLYGFSLYGLSSKNKIHTSFISCSLKLSLFDMTREDRKIERYKHLGGG